MALTAAERARRYRAKKRNENVTKRNENVTQRNVTLSPGEVEQTDGQPIGPSSRIGFRPPPPDCQCVMCRCFRAKGRPTQYLNHGPLLSHAELVELDKAARVNDMHRNRVPLPGDEDYV